MSSINMSIRTDSELKAQAEQVLSQLGMNMTGAINMFCGKLFGTGPFPFLFL